MAQSMSLMLSIMSSGKLCCNKAPAGKNENFVYIGASPKLTVQSGLLRSKFSDFIIIKISDIDITLCIKSYANGS